MSSGNCLGVPLGVDEVSRWPDAVSAGNGNLRVRLRRLRTRQLLARRRAAVLHAMLARVLLGGRQSDELSALPTGEVRVVVWQQRMCLLPERHICARDRLNVVPDVPSRDGLRVPSRIDEVREHRRRRGRPAMPTGILQDRDFVTLSALRSRLDVRRVSGAVHSVRRGIVLTGSRRDVHPMPSWADAALIRTDVLHRLPPRKARRVVGLGRVRRLPCGIVLLSEGRLLHPLPTGAVQRIQRIVVLLILPTGDLLELSWSCVLHTLRTRNLRRVD